MEPPGEGQAIPQESAAPNGGRKSSDVESEEQEREDEATVTVQPDESKRPKDTEPLPSESQSSEDDKEGREGGSSEAGTGPDGSDETGAEKRDSSGEGEGSDPGKGTPSQEDTAGGTADVKSQADSSADGTCSEDGEEGQKSAGEPTESSRDESMDPGDGMPEGKEEEEPEGKKSSAEAAAGGGWGWGGWNSLWSSVSTVTESAQVRVFCVLYGSRLVGGGGGMTKLGSLAIQRLSQSASRVHCEISTRSSAQLLNFGLELKKLCDEDV